VWQPLTGRKTIKGIGLLQNRSGFGIAAPLYQCLELADFLNEWAAPCAVFMGI